jgi:integrase/recombinase XerC
VLAYAFDLLNFLRFCATRELALSRVVAVDLFDYLDWQARPVKGKDELVVRLGRREAASAAGHGQGR